MWATLSLAMNPNCVDFAETLFEPCLFDSDSAAQYVNQFHVKCPKLICGHLIQLVAIHLSVLVRFEFRNVNMIGRTASWLIS